MDLKKKVLNKGQDQISQIPLYAGLEWVQTQ